MILYRIFRCITFPIRRMLLKIRLKDNESVLDEKLGRPTEDRPKGGLIWVHCNDAAESGEVVRAIQSVMPGKAILLTYNVGPATAWGHAPGAIRQFAPIDNHLVVRNFIRFWEPSAAVYIGAELRPIQLALLKKNDIPSFLVDGHIPDKSYRRWKWAKRLARKTMRNFNFVWAVDNVQTLRLANLGACDVKSQELIPALTRMREIIYCIRQQVE